MYITWKQRKISQTMTTMNGNGEKLHGQIWLEMLSTNSPCSRNSYNLYCKNVHPELPKPMWRKCCVPYWTLNTSQGMEFLHRIIFSKL